MKRLRRWLDGSHLRAADEAIEASVEATVRVRCADLGVEGSGFVVSPEGHVVTNVHGIMSRELQNGVWVVTHSGQVEVVLNGRSYEAEVLTSQQDDKPKVFDYAILRVAARPRKWLLPYHYDRVRVGEMVACVGYPAGIEETVVTTGVVSAKVRRPSHWNTLHQMNTILTDTTISYGSSGGPMVRVRDGRVMGINTLPHEISDELAHRLNVWRGQPRVANTAVSDLIDYVLKYVNVGFNYAVSLEYARQDPAWDFRRRLRKW